MSIVYIEKTDIGATLGTWFYCNMWQLYAANQLGHVGYINWPQDRWKSLEPHQDPEAFSRCPNMYEWYCEQPQWTEVSPPPRQLTWTWENCAEIGQYVLMSQPLDFIKQWYVKNLRFNQAVKSRTDIISAKYSIDFNNTLAVSWRGCDSYVDGRPRLPISVYFPFIDDILNANPNLKIFATAEETTVVDEIKNKYPNTFTINDFFSAPFGYQGHSEYVNPASGYERGMQTCCLINILSKCKYLVKNRSSTGSVASWLSNGNIVCLAHPENLGHGFDITKAEIKGKLYPLYR